MSMCSDRQALGHLVASSCEAVSILIVHQMTPAKCSPSEHKKTEMTTMENDVEQELPAPYLLLKFIPKPHNVPDRKRRLSY